MKTMDAQGGRLAAAVGHLRGLAGHLPGVHGHEVEKVILLLIHRDAAVLEEDLNDGVVRGGGLLRGSGREAKMARASVVAFTTRFLPAAFFATVAKLSRVLAKSLFTVFLEVLQWRRR